MDGITTKMIGRAAATSPADSELDQRWLAGEEGAMAEVHGRYRRRLEGVAFRIVGNRADAEDVVQRVFVALPRAAYDGTASLWSYLYRAAVNGSVNLLRSRKRRVGLEREVLSQARMRGDASQGPEAQVLEGEILAAVAKALLEVKPQHRVALVLHIHHGLTNVEIAEREQVPPATVGTWLRRGREELREALGPLLRDVGRNRP
ncbi:MAG: sigma-70 family RNA polymerase sigma factor [bacterium]|nr:sigma-70 family RNA polymerase sigma factor [bacterium]MCP5066398.1 sigma-70 family RNA polymerase sigma factor [bacterium]